MSITVIQDIVVCVPANAHTFFMPKKIEQAANPTLSTMYCYSLVLALLSFCICCCCCACCKMKFFSLSATNCSTKRKINSLLFKTIASFPPFRKGWPFFCVRLHTYYYILTIKSSKFHKSSKKTFS